MNFRRLVSAVAALAVAGTCVVTSGVSVLAADETVETTLKQSASGQNDSQTLVLNLEGATTLTNPTFNASSSTYKGVAVLEFEVPAVDPDKITGSTLTVSLHNTGNRGGTRTYNIYGSTGITLSSSTTYSDVLGILGSSLYTGTGLYDGNYRNDIITDTNITEYIKSKVSADAATDVQIAFSNAAQMFEILMGEDENLTGSAAPTLTLTVTTDTTYTVSYTVNSGTDVMPTVTVYTDEDMTEETSTFIVGNTYYYKAVADGYEDTIGDFINSDASKTEITVDISMNKKSYAESAVVQYVDYDNSENVLYSYTEYDTASQTSYVGDTVTYYFPKYYVTDEGALYEAVVTEYNSRGTAYYARTSGALTADVDSNIQTVQYKKTSDGPAQFAEVEDLLNTTEYGPYWEISSGYARRSLDSTKNKLITIEKTGIYSVTASTFTRSTSSGGTASFYIGNDDDTVAFMTTDGTSSYNGADESSTIVAFTAGDEIYVKTTGSQICVDYILAVMLDPAIEEVVVTETTLDANTTLTGVGVDSKTTDEAQTVINYQFKVVNWAEELGLPSLTFDAEIEEGTDTLVPTIVSTDLPYYYTSDGYYYFTIQTLGISDIASGASLNGTDFDGEIDNQITE